MSDDETDEVDQNSDRELLCLAYSGSSATVEFAYADRNDYVAEVDYNQDLAPQPTSRWRNNTLVFAFEPATWDHWVVCPEQRGCQHSWDHLRFRTVKGRLIRKADSVQQGIFYFRLHYLPKPESDTDSKAGTSQLGPAASDSKAV